MDPINAFVPTDLSCLLKISVKVAVKETTNFTNEKSLFPLINTILSSKNLTEKF